MNLPVNELAELAQKHGLKTPLDINIRRSIANGYNPLTKKIGLKPYRSKTWTALKLSHEIKHQIDLQSSSGYLAILLYWPLIIGVGLWLGITTHWYWGVVGSVLAYLLHPFEVRANIYALRYWRQYLEILKK